MTAYLNHGERDYAASPIPVSFRETWEFQAVVRGRCAPLFRDSRQALAERTLWAFPPRQPHGWTGEAGRPCDVFVFHFRAVPEIMERLVPRGTCAEARLTDAEVRRIRSIYGTLRELGNRSDAVSTLREQECLLSLCLTIATRMSPATRVEESRPGSMVLSSLAWYEENMAAAPRLSVVARQANVSSSHLRRVYRSVMQASPRSEFAKRRFSRAKYLLAVTSLGIAEIASDTGYGSASSFSRAFRNAVGISPDHWRRRQRKGPQEWQP